MMIFNFARIVNQSMELETLHWHMNQTQSTDPLPVPLSIIIIQAVTIAIIWGCFNVAHWMFAFQYYQIARQASFAIELEYIPERIINADNLLNSILFALNTVIPILFGLSNFGAGYLSQYRKKNIPKWISIADIILSNSVVLLQIISGLFLFFAIFRIKNLITKEDSALVNISAMILHSTAFGLYIVAAIVNQVFYEEVLEYHTTDDHKHTHEYS